MTEITEKDFKSKQYFIKSQYVVVTGYILTQVSTFLAKILNVSPIRYIEILIILSFSVLSTLIVTIIVAKKKNVTHDNLHIYINIQFFFWLLLYMFWVFFLQEARIFALLFAFLPLIFLATNSSLKQSMFLTISVTIIHLGSSYTGIFIANQKGSFEEVLLSVSCFLPSALYIAYVAGLFHNKRRELRKSKNEAETVRDALWGEMELAKKIQTMLLPKEPDMTGYEIASYMNPAIEVGGDYYDVITVDGYKWVIIGDVSGHGVPAGLVMMMVQTAIHNTLEDNPKVSPSELLVKINKTISSNLRLMDESKYMTMTVFAVLENSNIIYAGLHQDVLIYRKKTESVEIIKTEGMWIGLVDEIASMLKDKKFHLDTGDCMLLFTDGVTESWEIEDDKDRNQRTNRYFGKDKLIDVLRINGESSPELIKKAILKELHFYNSDDDVTFLILRRVYT